MVLDASLLNSHHYKVREDEDTGCCPEDLPRAVNYRGSGERGSGISMLPVRYDDNDDYKVRPSYLLSPLDGTQYSQKADISCSCRYTCFQSTWWLHYFEKKETNIVRKSAGKCEREWSIVDSQYRRLLCLNLVSFQKKIYYGWLSGKEKSRCFFRMYAYVLALICALHTHRPLDESKNFFSWGAKSFKKIRWTLKMK